MKFHAVLSRGHDHAAVTAVAFLPSPLDSPSSPVRLITGDQLCRLRLWDIPRGRVIASWNRSLPATSTTTALSPSQPVDSVLAVWCGAAFNYDGRFITQSRCGTVSLWDTESKTAYFHPVARLLTKTTSFARGCRVGEQIGPGPLVIAPASTSQFGVFDFRDAASGCSNAAPKIRFGSAPQIGKDLPSNPAWVVGCCPLAGLGPTFFLVAYEAKASQAVFDLRKPGECVSFSSAAKGPFSVKEVTAVETSGSQSWVATATGAVLVSEIRPTTEISPSYEVAFDCEPQPQVPTAKVAKRDWTPSAEWNARLLDDLEAESRSTKELHCKRGIGSLAVTSGAVITAAAGSWSGTCHVVHSSNRGIIEDLRFHQGSISAVNFSADDSLLATASADSAIALWKQNNHPPPHGKQSNESE